jgi:type II secretory pathway component PulF
VTDDVLTSRHMHARPFTGQQPGSALPTAPMISHKLLANWYLQLSQHLDAGIALAEALRLSKGPPPGDRQRLASAIEAGDDVAQVMKHAPSWLPSADRIFICAGQQTGRLPQTLSTLSDRHSRIGANQLKAILGLVYPIGVFHIAALVLPLVRMIDFEVGFEWSASQHLLLSAALLLPLWALILCIYFLAKTENPLLPRLMQAIPLLRRYTRAQALADLAYALGTFLETGVPIQSAWKHSVRLTRSPRLTAAYRQIEPILKRGEDPADSLGNFAVFPPDFVAFYTSGAQSGKLDQNLLTAGQRFQAQANQAMTFAAIVYPSLLFAGVAGCIAYSIFQVYGGYVDMLMDLAE